MRKHVHSYNALFKSTRVLVRHVLLAMSRYVSDSIAELTSTCIFTEEHLCQSERLFINILQSIRLHLQNKCI